ncbi:unnamed protein product [Lathyrus sativus]|nr:unnamed protein product [Lathyrus sativus]
MKTQTKQGQHDSRKCKVLIPTQQNHETKERVHQIAAKRIKMETKRNWRRLNLFLLKICIDLNSSPRSDLMQFQVHVPFMNFLFWKVGSRNVGSSTLFL